MSQVQPVEILQFYSQMSKTDYLPPTCLASSNTKRQVAAPSHSSFLDFTESLIHRLSSDHTPKEIYFYVLVILYLSYSLYKDPNRFKTHRHFTAEVTVRENGTTHLKSFDQTVTESGTRQRGLLDRTWTLSLEVL